MGYTRVRVSRLVFVACVACCIISEASPPPKTAFHSLHRKLFHNYRDWCESMRVAPVFTSTAPPDHYGGADKAEVQRVSSIPSLLYVSVENSLRAVLDCACVRRAELSVYCLRFGSPIVVLYYCTVLINPNVLHGRLHPSMISNGFSWG